MHLLPVPAEVPRRREARAAIGAEEQARAVAVLTVGLGVRNLRGNITVVFAQNVLNHVQWKINSFLHKKVLAYA